MRCYSGWRCVTPNHHWLLHFELESAFNSDGTGSSIYSSGTFTSTWSINSAGKLILNSTTSGNISTLTIASTTGTVIIASEVNTDTNNPANNSTVTVTLTAQSQAQPFTTSMISGKTFNTNILSPQRGSSTTSFNSNGTFTQQFSESTSVGNWEINQVGQLVTTLTTPSSGNVNTNTLIGINGNVLLVYNVTTYANNLMLVTTSTFIFTPI